MWRDIEPGLWARRAGSCAWGVGQVPALCNRLGALTQHAPNSCTQGKQLEDSVTVGSLALQPGEFMVRAFKGALACSEAAAPNGAATCKVPKLPIKKSGC